MIQNNRPEADRPFQFSLRALFVITTVLALWLGLAKLSLAIAIAMPMFLLPIVPFYLIGRSLMGFGRKTQGIACIATGVIVVVGLLFSLAMGVALDMSLAVGLTSLFLWFFVMAAREEKLQRAKEERERLAEFITGNGGAPHDQSR